MGCPESGGRKGVSVPRPYNGMKWICHSRRWAIYWRDRDPVTGAFRCMWCLQTLWTSSGKKRFRLSLDHLLPVSDGGTHTPENLITACVPCNATRGDCSFEDWCGSSQFDPTTYERIMQSISTPLDMPMGRLLASIRPTGRRKYPHQFLGRKT